MDTVCKRGNLEGWRTDRRPWGVGNDGRIGNLLEKTQCERGDISQRKWKFYFSSRRWTNQTSWRRSGTENIHLDTGTPNSRRKSRRFSWRIRRVSSITSRLTSGCRWSYKWFLVHVRKLHIPPSRWTQSQTLLAEWRIIPLFHWYFFWRLQNYSYELECFARKSHRRLLEHRWVKRFVWFLDRFHSVYSIGRETSRRIHVVRERLTRRQLTSRPDHLWPDSGLKWKEMLSWRRDINGPMKNRNSIMPEDYEEIISLTLRTRNSKKPFGTLARNWKRRWLLLCFARQASNVSMGRPAAKPMRSKQNLRAS